MKLLEAELSGLNAEGDRFRVRFTHRGDRGQVLDVLLKEAPDFHASDIGKTFTLIAEPLKEVASPEPETPQP